MKRCGLWLLVVANCLSALWGQEQAHIVRFTHGNWFDGVAFHPQTWYSVNGFLRSKEPSTIDQTIDLKGKFVVPASEKHTTIALPEITPRRSTLFWLKVPSTLRTRPICLGSALASGSTLRMV